MESLLEKHPLAKAPDLEARLSLWDQKQVRKPSHPACAKPKSLFGKVDHLMSSNVAQMFLYAAEDGR